MLKRFLNNFINIVYPKHCFICHDRLKSNALDNIVCMDCWSKIKKNIPPFCNRCGRHMESNQILKNICGKCQRINLTFDRAFSPCLYEGALKEMIHQFKYSGKDYLGHTLSRLLINFIKDYNLDLKLFDLIMPMPLHQRKLREREFNQARILSDFVASEFDIKLSKNHLVRIRDTSTQTDLNDEQRWRNVKDAFIVKQESELKRKNILLIDDVLSTGATCSEAARVLKNAGCGIVFVLTLAN